MSCSACSGGPLHVKIDLNSTLCPDLLPPSLELSRCNFFGLGAAGPRPDGPFPALADHLSDFSPAKIIAEQAIWTPVQKIIFSLASILTAASDDVSAASLNDTLRNLVVSLKIHVGIQQGRAYPFHVPSARISAGKAGSNSADIAQVFQILNDTIDNQADQLTQQDRLGIAGSFGLALFGVSSPVVRSLGAAAIDVFELWALNVTMHGLGSAGPNTLFGLEETEEFLKGILTDKGFDCCKELPVQSSDILINVALPIQTQVVDADDPTKSKTLEFVLVGRVPAQPVGTGLTRDEWLESQLLGKNSPFNSGSALITTDDTGAIAGGVLKALKEAFQSL